MGIRILRKKSLLLLIMLFAVGWANAQNIDFADPNVKAICVANWDTNGDGEISYSEAAAVTNLGNVFRHTAITSFNELQYFTGLTSLVYEGDSWGTFASCTNLSSIIIPNAVTVIGKSAFESCTNLTSITIPSSVLIIDEYAFESCTSLTSITIPSSVTEIGDEAFQLCTGLTSVTIPNSVVSIGFMVFAGCSSLENITVEGGNPVYDSRNNCNAIIKTATNTLLSGCINTYIPSTVTTIGLHAFYGTGLTSIVIPNSVTSIGGAAFSNCTSLTSVTIPNSVTEIGEGTFVKCSSLTTVTIPNSVTSIGTSAFKNCTSLTSVTIPNSVSSIGNIVFAGCSSLESITVEGGNPVFDSRDNCNAIIKTATNTLVSGCINTIIPNTVTTIGSYAFNGTGLTSIVIPNSVTSIGESAFANCTGLTTMSVLTSMPPILGSRVFYGVDKSIPLFVPTGTVNAYTSTEGWNEFTNFSEYSVAFADENVEAICVDNWDTDEDGYLSYAEAAAVTDLGDAFQYNEDIISFDELQYFTGLTSLEYEGTSGIGTFCGCNSLTSIVIPNSVTVIGDFAFQDCSSLTSITIPNTVVSIGEGAFSYCTDIASLFVPNTVTAIGISAFEGCENLNSIVLPEALTSIEENLFNGCSSLSSINIPNAVTSIGANSFNWCTSLSSITIPGSVTTIGEGCFSGCTGITSMNVEPTTPPVLGVSAFEDVVKSIPVYVSGGLASVYRTTDGWEEFTNYIETSIVFADANVEAICLDNWDTNEDGKLSMDEAVAVTDLGDVFQNNTEITSFNELQYFTGLTSLVFEGDIWGTFYGCTDLTTVVIPNTVSFIGDDAFEECTSLESIIIPNSVTSIGGYAFYFCTSLTSIEIPGSVTSIGEAPFGGCSGLEQITVEEGNPAYDSRDNCNAIIETNTNKLISGCKNTIIPSSVNSIGESAFESCTSLTSITISSSVTEIGDYAFWGTGLTSITIPNSVQLIGGWIVGRCVNLEQIIVEEGNPAYDSRDNCNAIIETNTNKLIAGCKNTIIPSSVNSIGESAFDGCTDLTSIIIPGSVTEIGDYAFATTGLTSLTVMAATPPTLYYYVFEEVDKSIPVYVPYSSLSAYEAADGWNEFTNFIGLAPGDIAAIAEPAEAGMVTGAGHYEYQTCTLTATTNEGYVFVRWTENGEEVSTEAVYTFPVVGDRSLVAHFVLMGNIAFTDANVKALCVANWDTDGDGEISYAEADMVTDLGGVFQGNEDITSFDELQYFTGLTSIGNQAFAGCDNLNSIVLPETLASIGDGAFMTSGPDVSSELTSITIPNMVTSIGDEAFAGLGLTLITLPNSVTSIGINPFAGCTGLETITVEEGNTVYDSRDNCNAIIETATNTLISGCQNTIIPNTVTSIGVEAFAGSGLTSMVIPGSVQSIGDLAFGYCTDLTSFIIFSNNVEMGYNVFDGVELPENADISVIASPNDGGGVLGIYNDNGLNAFIGTFDDYNIDFAFVPQGIGQIYSGIDAKLLARQNDGWQFVGWRLNNEIVSYESILSFEAFGSFDFEAVFEPCSSEPEPELDPELLSGRFSVSGCTTVGFARSNAKLSVDILALFSTIEGGHVGEDRIEELTDQFIQNGFSSLGEFTALGIDISGLNYEIGQNQWDRMVYDASTLNGNFSAYNELLLNGGVDLIPSALLKNNIDCWHIPTWREWDYLLNQRETPSGVRFAFATVNEVCGLVVLPDDWNATTYDFNNPNEVADYTDNTITAGDWIAVLEPAGAVFLPFNGYLVQGQLIQESSDGQAVGAYPGLFVSPGGDFMGMMEGLPMTGPMTLFPEIFMSLSFMSADAFGGSSIRFVKIMESTTVNISVASNDDERGTVTGAGEFACQQNCTVRATANEGYVFQHWLEGDEVVSIDPEYRFTAYGDRDLTAVFVPVDDVCQLAVEVKLNSSQSATLEMFGFGVSVDFDDATPSYYLPIGTVLESFDFLSIIQLLAAGSSSGSEEKSYQYTFFTPRQTEVQLGLSFSEGFENALSSTGSLDDINISFTVNYVNGETIVENETELPIAFESDCEGVSFIVSAEPDNLEFGSVNDASWYEEAFPYGESCTLTATPAEGYQFMGWTCDGELVSTETSYTFTVTRNAHYVAHFGLYSITVSVNTIDGGGVIGVEGSSDEPFIGSIELPETGNQMPSYTFGTYGQMEAIGGSMVQLVAHANSGWHFVGWREEDEIVSTDRFYVFTVEANRDLEAVFESCDYLPESEMLSGLFSVSDCTTVGFANSNVTMSIDLEAASASMGGNIDMQTYMNLAMSSSAFGVSSPGINWEFGENQWDRVTYDVATINENSEAYYELLQTGFDVFPSYMLKSDIDCWHILTWREWDYLLNQRQTTSGVRYAYAKVNDVCGLVVLPDDWNATTYAFSNPNEVAGYENNNITANQWTTVLEPAGAVFLPVNGYMSFNELVQETSDGNAVGAYPGLFISTNGDYIGGNGITMPMTGPHTMAMDLFYPTQTGISLNGTSLRLAKIMNSSTVEVVVATNQPERGSVVGGGIVQCQENCTVTATTNDGFVFQYWMEDDQVVSIDSEYSFTARGDRNLTAVFSPEDEVREIDIDVAVLSTMKEIGSMEAGFSLTFDDGTPAIQLPLVESPDEINMMNWLMAIRNIVEEETITFKYFINCGSTVNLSWMPGYLGDTYAPSFMAYFADGMGIVEGENSTENLPVDFEVDCSTYNISATALPTEGGNVTGTGEYIYGTNCTLQAIANSGYIFKYWKENGSIVSIDASYTFPVIEERNLEAYFVEFEYEYQENCDVVFNLSDSYGDGWNGNYLVVNYGDHSEQLTITNGSSATYSRTIPTGSNVTLSWVQGSYIQECSFIVSYENGDVIYQNQGSNLNGNSYGFTVNCGVGIPVFYHIMASANPSVGGIVSEEDYYLYGQTCTLVATANEGYTFMYWTENDVQVSSSPTYSFVVDRDRNLTAHFTAPVTIVAVASPIEGGAVNGAGEYVFGNTCTLTATPNEGYAFVAWTEDGNMVSTDAIYSFSVTSDRNLVAVFLPTYVITAEANNADYGTVTGGGTYVVNVTCTVTAMPAEGYEFVNWTENGEVVSTEAEYAFTVTGDRILVANFVLKNYDILATANPSEGGTVSGAGNYNHFETCTLVATANEGYTFINWTLDGAEVSAEPSYTFTVTEDGAYVANFMLNSYTITALANPSEGGTVSGAGDYNHFETCTLTATASEGYDFDNWTMDGAVVGTDPTYAFTVTGPAEYVANFSLKSYDITATVTPSGAGTVTGTGTYYHGSQCTLTAIANEGYAFSNWMENGEVVSTDATYAFTVTGEHSLVAAFLPTYVVTVEANNAAYGTVTGGGTYEEGETCTVTATPAEGYVFSAWTEDGVTVSTDAIYGFTVESAHNLVAVFLPTYVITAEANNADYGTVTGGGTYVVNVTCTVTAMPAEGYEFVNWTENGEVVSTEAEYAFTVTGDRILVANFVLKNYDILATANPSEGGTVSGAGNYNHFETCTLVATANEGYTFINWTLDGAEVSTEPTYTFTVTGGGAYVANFMLNSYTITVLANPSEGGTVSGAGDYNHFETCTLTATASEGYDFDNWTMDGEVVSTDPTYAFTVTGPAEYVANFSLKSYDITATVTPSGAGTVTGTGTYYHGSQCTLTAIANEGYAFSAWLENGETVSNDVTYGFTVTGERSLVAVFLPTYVITAEANNPDYGSVTGGGTYVEGETCTLTASPNEGYVFSAWTEDGETVSTDATYSFTVTDDRNLVAVFLPTYVITAVANDPNYGTVTGGGNFVVGTTCTLVATPAEGYEFINWTENGETVHTEAEYSFTVEGNRSLVANFSLKHYDITVEANPEAGGTVSGGGNYGHFETCTLTATVNWGYTFINWTLDGNVVSDESSYTFTVTSAGEYVANFSLNSYAINASANPNEGGAVSGAGTYDHGAECTLSATANTGYNFDNWTLDGTVMSTEPNYTFTVTSAGDYVANFSLKTYDITATVTPTDAGVVTGTGNYTHGTQCTLTATPNEGYAFSAWLENGVTVSNDVTYGFTVTGERSLVASFLPTYVITAEANNADYGTVTGGGIYVEGELCTLTASPNEGYVFSAWTEDGETVSTDATYGFTVTGERSLVAVFLPTYVITAEANNADYGTVTGGGTYVVGTTCTLVATPAEGYEFINWTENGETVHTEAEYSFTVEGNRSLVANFSLKHYDITVEANPEAGGTVSGGGNYGHFETCTLTATVNWGYTFINWTLNGVVVSTEPSYTFTVTAAGDYTANFQLNNYVINASANPSDGGAVSGAGNYDHGTECTLTATASVGYTFVNWTLDGNEVSTEPTYTFTVYGEAAYLANFSLNLYEITAIANPAEGGTITGAGNYYHGDGCILTAIPNENFTFLYWTENGNYLSSDATYSFIATSDRSLVAIFAGNEQTISLNQGWTWLSSYIEMDGIDGLGMLEEGLNPNGVMIKSQRDGFLSYAGGMWIGTLDGITNEKMYLVNTNEPAEITFTGPVANMINHPITLSPNWTWIGYPSPFALDVNDALANLNASEGDVVKTQSVFATYSVVDGWIGSLSQLTPGMGLMYHSHNNQTLTFTYGIGMSRSLKANLTAENNHWVPDIHAYPNNMNIMAVVELNGKEVEDERYELAIFDGNECRGSVRLVYVESLRRYVAFLSVAGEEDTELCLALYDTRTDKAYYNTTDCLNFEANAVLGSLSLPYVARFGENTGLDDWGDPTVELYPNPVSRGHLFQIELPAESSGARISIINALGALVTTTDVFAQPATLRAPEVPGVYTVKVTTDKQGTYCRKLIVK